MGKHILVAFGGVSPEHEVSVISGMQAAHALKESGNTIIPLYISKSGRMLTGPQLLDLETYKDLKVLEQNAAACTFQTDSFGKTVLVETGKSGFFSKPATYPVDTVLVAFHGSDGENGGFQGLCEMYNLPYTGSGPLASSVGMDKRASKMHAASLGIPVVEDVLITEQLWIDKREALLEDIKKLGDVVVVKPLRLGSSIGVKRATGIQEISAAIETGFRYDALLLVEKAVTPLIEINCSVLGDFEKAEVSVCEQPIGKDDSLSFEDKYMGEEGKGMASASRIIPAPISQELTNSIQQASLKLFRSMDAGGVARFDFLVHKDTHAFYFNEINTIPGSFSFYLWDKTDLPFPALMNRLVELAQKRHRQKNGRIRTYETNLLSSKAVKGIKNCLDFEIPVQINTTITEYNYEEFEKITDFVAELGVKSHHPFFLVPVGRGKKIEKDSVKSQKYNKLIENIVEKAELKETMKLKKELGTSVKRKKLFGIPKLEDANMAGTSESHKCTLILTEGDSAKSLAMSGIQVAGRDYYGVFPLKGKFLNVRDCPTKQILENDEV